jgi:hypothetical protein
MRGVAGTKDGSTFFHNNNIIIGWQLGGGERFHIMCDGSVVDGGVGGG